LEICSKIGKYPQNTTNTHISLTIYDLSDSVKRYVIKKTLFFQ